MALSSLISLTNTDLFPGRESTFKPKLPGGAIISMNCDSETSLTAEGFFVRSVSDGSVSSVLVIDD
eukprot:CAMPEP_0196215264 /NCGR_PEP_ID=MMETSP0912-20130531/29497_1 /TAXON_ID=49265 /ORGANISM="Thalassiosira rotula, Strain GSO102" /LENGTH=65 /DNA_ID=CAMNT_0041492105 /DNA_START=124 /DNA_END=318 /DNA_ORIENTATION=+